MEVIKRSQKGRPSISSSFFLFHLIKVIPHIALCYLTLTSLNLSKPNNLLVHLENWFGSIIVKYDTKIFAEIPSLSPLLSLFHYSLGFSLITRQDESLCQRPAEILLFAFTSILHHPNYKPLMRHFQHLTDLK